MHPALKRFFGALQEWVEAGTPDDPVFTKHVGVCGNCNRYFAYVTSYTKELRLMLREYGHPVTPFNTDITEYEQEAQSGTVWNNKERLAFVKQHAEDVCRQS